MWQCIKCETFNADAHTACVVCSMQKRISLARQKEQTEAGAAGGTKALRGAANQAGGCQFAYHLHSAQPLSHNTAFLCDCKKIQ